MAQRPRDIPDLFLAPVLLQLEARLESLGRLSHDDLKFELVLQTNFEPQSAEERRESARRVLVRDLELHGWSVSWDPRGLRVAHGEHALVLGVPSNLRDYLQG